MELGHPEHVEHEEGRRDVEARVLPGREDHRVGAAGDAQRVAGRPGRNCSGQSSRPAICRYGAIPNAGLGSERHQEQGNRLVRRAQPPAASASRLPERRFADPGGRLRVGGNADRKRPLFARSAGTRPQVDRDRPGPGRRWQAVAGASRRACGRRSLRGSATGSSARAHRRPRRHGSRPRRWRRRGRPRDALRSRRGSRRARGGTCRPNR